jgi:hypothetical protein
MKRVLASLSFSFLIVGGVLVWQGYRELTRPRPGEVIGWRVAMYFVVGGLCFALGLRGVKERHRPDDAPPPPPPGEDEEGRN